MDVTPHDEGVTLALDRAGVTGAGGPSHNDMWDLSVLGLVPGIEISAPKGRTRLVAALERTVTVQNAPTVLRYSKERFPNEMPAVVSRSKGRDRVDLLRVDVGANVLVIEHGQFTRARLEVTEELAATRLACAVADPAWCIPLSTELTELAREHETTVNIENSLVIAGLGGRLRARLAEEAPGTRVLASGTEQEFLAQGTRGEILEELGLMSRHIARRVLERILQERRTVTQSA